MSKVQAPNARCACGSGKKYKNCHGVSAEGGPIRKGVPLWGISLAVVGAVIAFVVYLNWGKTPQPAGPAPAGKVWSEEHGHWH